jgi:lysophospholipase L1-like esterase
MRRVSRGWTAVAAVLMAFGSPAVAVAAPSVRVMIVGDSISQGSAGDFTWRYRLWKHLAPRVSGLDFVGPRTDLFDNVANLQGSQAYVDPAFDQDHNAIWGRTLAAAADTIEDQTAAYTPDVMLVLLGINDLVFLTSPADTETVLRRFIANARVGQPGVKLLLGRIPPKRGGASASQIADYNSRLATVAAQLSTAASPIAVANTDGGYDPAVDTWDGTHPNATGEQKIAAGFADRLASAFALGAAYPRPLPQVPLGPQTAPVLSLSPGDGVAGLSWTLSPGATGYYVWVRSVTAGEAMHRLPYPLPGSSWTASLLVNGATYQFQLQTTKGDTTGAFSNVATVTPTVPPPAGPGDLVAISGNGEATLAWTPTAHSTGAYIWVRNVTAGETLHRLPWPVTPPWTAGLMVNGATYQFRVQSVSGLIEGGMSNTVSVTPSGPAPRAPSDLTATPGNGQAVLRWTPTAHSTGAYIWVRNVTAGEALHRLPWPVTPPWTAGLMVNGATYEFKVQSVNGLIEGGVSAPATVVPVGPIPAPPQNVWASSGDGTITLHWSASPHATGYYIWVMDWPFNGGFHRLPYPVTGTSFTYAPATNGHRYWFVLQPVNGLQEADCVPLSIGHSSGCSNQAAASPEAPWNTLPLGSWIHAQETSTRCGPAAVQATLSYFGENSSQSTLDSELGTGPIGTYPWNIPGVLNNHLSTGYYTYSVDVGWVPLYFAVVHSVNNGLGPLILLVHSNRRPWNGGGSSLLAHYIVVVGYKNGDYLGRGPMLRVWDPADGSYHEMYASDWSNMKFGVSFFGQWILGWVISPAGAFF